MPGKAYVRLINITSTPVSLSFLERSSNAQFGLPLETPMLDVGVLNVQAGSYVLSFADTKTNLELEATLQAGTFYCFYVFQDGEDLAVNVDVDGILGTTVRGDKK